MRTDLPSMNAGKAMAQASHASNAFVKMAEGDLHEIRAQMTEQWKTETSQGFGTVLVLAATQKEIEDAVEAARLNMLIAGQVTDPTYPYRVDNIEIANLIPTSVDTAPRSVPLDTKTPVTLYRREVTCGFIFGDKDDYAGEVVKHLKLHP